MRFWRIFADSIDFDCNLFGVLFNFTFEDGNIIVCVSFNSQIEMVQVKQCFIMQIRKNDEKNGHCKESKIKLRWVSVPTYINYDNSKKTNKHKK